MDNPSGPDLSDGLPRPTDLLRALDVLGFPTDLFLFSKDDLAANVQRAGSEELLTLELVHLLSGVVDVQVKLATMIALEQGADPTKAAGSIVWAFRGAGLGLETGEAGPANQLFIVEMIATRLANMMAIVAAGHNQAQHPAAPQVSAAYLLATGLSMALTALAGLSPLPDHIGMALQRINHAVQVLTELLPSPVQGVRETAQHN